VKSADARALPERVDHLWTDVHGDAATRGLADRLQDVFRILITHTEALAEARAEIGRQREELEALRARVGPPL